MYNSVFTVSEALPASLSSAKPQKASPEEDGNGRVSCVVAVVLLSRPWKARWCKPAWELAGWRICLHTNAEWGDEQKDLDESEAQESETVTAIFCVLDV